MCMSHVEFCCSAPEKSTSKQQAKHRFFFVFDRDSTKKGNPGWRDFLKQESDCSPSTRAMQICIHEGLGSRSLGHTGRCQQCVLSQEWRRAVCLLLFAHNNNPAINSIDLASQIATNLILVDCAVSPLATCLLSHRLIGLNLLRSLFLLLQQQSCLSAPPLDAASVVVLRRRHIVSLTLLLWQTSCDWIGGGCRRFASASVLGRLESWLAKASFHFGVGWRPCCTGKT